MIALIIALPKNRVIGNNNDLPWGKIETDMALFRSTTMGASLIMGRKTFESIGSKPLTGRRNIVVSSNLKSSDPEVFVARSIEEALSISVEPVFFIGGARIYEEAESYCDTAYVTHIPLEAEGDIKMSESFLSEEKWVLESRVYVYDRKSDMNLSFERMTKSSNTQH